MEYMEFEHPLERIDRMIAELEAKEGSPKHKDAATEVMNEAAEYYESLCSSGEYNASPFLDLTEHLLTVKLPLKLAKACAERNHLAITGNIVRKGKKYLFSIRTLCLNIEYQMPIQRAELLYPLLSFLYTRKQDIILVGTVDKNLFTVMDLLLNSENVERDLDELLRRCGDSFGSNITEQFLCRQVIRRLLSRGAEPYDAIFSNHYTYTSALEMDMLLTFFEDLYPSDVQSAMRYNMQKQKRKNLSSTERSVASKTVEMLGNIQWCTPKIEYPSIEDAKIFLDKRLWGMSHVKQRVLEILAQLRNPQGSAAKWGILLQGPPGVGKTAVGQAIAELLGRPLFYLDMGSVIDSEGLCGSSPIYANSQAGLIFSRIAQENTPNLTCIINEMDKAFDSVSTKKSSSCGAVLLSLLDKDNGFLDASVGVPIKLENMFFIATANSLDVIPKPLLDRFLVIEMSAYDSSELEQIWKTHVLPKLKESAGIVGDTFMVERDAAELMCRNYCTTVRDLEKYGERLLGDYLLLREQDPTVRKSYTLEDITQILGPAKHIKRSILHQPGIARSVYVKDGIAAETCVEAMVLPSDGGKGDLHIIRCPSAELRAQVEAAYYCAVKHGLVRSRDRVAVQLDTNIPPDLDGHYLPMAVFAAIYTAVTHKCPDKSVAYVGGVDILGNIWTDASVAEKIIRCCRENNIDLLFAPSIHEHIRIPMGDTCLMELHTISEICTYLGFGVVA